MMPEVLVLGAVGVRCGQRLHQPGSGVSRALLALLAEAGPAGLTEHRMAEVVWRAEVSASAFTVAVHRLRRWLRGVSDDGLRIDRTPTGYRLGPAGVATDLGRFRALVTEAVEGSAPDRAATLGRAVALWRGPALADVPVDRADPALLAALDRELRAAVVAHGRALLDAGKPAEAARALEPRAQQHPLDEAMHATWIEAMARTGRTTEAISAFHAIRCRLRDEFGINPGRELGQALATALRSRPAREPGAVAVPAQLPLDAAGFTGRHAELAALTTAMASHRAVVIVGMGGVGKTDLAVHWAHRAAEQFPDGQLYVDLRGYASEPPLRPIDALHRFLRALGPPTDQLPTDVDEAASRYRSLVGDRRILVVLDNAADADQVRPLLPGTSAGRVLITGRGGLDGLVAVNGAARLGLDVLTEPAAVALLRWSLGDEVVDAEPAAARELVLACGLLPLAIRVAALRFTVSGAGSIAAYTTRLGRNGRLAELMVDGDSRADLGAVFDHSYRRLPESTRRLFRLLGAVPGAEFTIERTAALAGLAPIAAQREIDRLVAVHLLTSPAAGRYRLPDLLREHARSQDALTPA